MQLYYNSFKEFLKTHRGFIAKSCLATSHISLVFISFLFYNFQRSYYQVISAYIAAVIVELVLFRSTGRYKTDSTANRCLSAVSEAAGLIVLIRTLNPHYYVMGSILAVASKYLILNFKGRHMFNPTNFVIVMTIAFSSPDLIQLRPDEFSYSLYPIIHVLFFGVLATVFARVWIIPLTYIATFALISLLFGGSLVYGNWVDIIGPELGATGLIFIFLMITDPATSPRSQLGKALFASTTAILCFYLRTQLVVYANYIALFIMYISFNASTLLLAALPSDLKVRNFRQLLRKPTPAAHNS